MRRGWCRALRGALLGIALAATGVIGEARAEEAASARVGDAAPVRTSATRAAPEGKKPAEAGGEGQGAEAPRLQDASEAIPDLVLDLRYATENNFLKEAVYPEWARCLLRPGTVRRLARVADRLREEDGTRLLIYDCYRPLSVQRKMWEIMPVRGYVAPPSRGSVHNRGGAVDLGLARADGTPLPMPTDFDEFSRRAWHSHEGGTEEERANRKRLRDAMLAEGFTPIRMEWWHYEDPDEKGAPVLDLPFPAP